MNTKDLIRLGVPTDAPLKLGVEFIVNSIDQGGDISRLEEAVAAIVANPGAFLGDPQREAFARALYEPAFKQREKLASWRQWGSGLEPDAVKHMANACALPVSVAGALMPDAHLGYGLPIGGVLATENAVIPYAAGVLGIIPGSMASPGFVVRGKGEPESLHSASHTARAVS